MRSALALLVALGVAAPAAARAQSPLSHEELDAAFDAIMGPQLQLRDRTEVAPVRTWTEPPPAGYEAEVEVSLRKFSSVTEAAVEAARAQSTERQGPALVLGSGRYTGEAVGGILHLDVELALTLGREGEWKAVPLVGPGAILVDARVGDAPIGVTTANGYQVWHTQQAGELVVRLKVLVPPRGPRGSIEYELGIPRTPVTHFQCDFPAAGLEPRIDGAVRADVAAREGGTRLTASLRPTTRVHLVGFRDLGDADSEAARVYAESLHLLSVDDGAVELFSELRYTILYAGTKRFDVRIPAGMTVVSAEGKGAFRWEVAEDAEGAVLRGETAYPIRDAYEISLRLERDTRKGGGSFPVALPRSVGAERDAAWLAVEVPGKMRLEEGERGDGVSAIDVRQLPPELVRSAVSPILKAYRFADAGGQLSLSVTRLPERDIASESIDRARVFTVVSPEGASLTELRLTLRNRLRHGLAVELPEGARVRSVLLDGDPAKPSRDDAGRLLLPLKRSEGSAAALTPITLQLVYEDPLDGFGPVGARELALPSLELPVVSLEWSVYLPGDNVYGTLSSAPDSGAYWGEGTWTPPVIRDDAGLGGEAAEETFDALDEASGVASAEAGAMPVRITLPTTGVRLDVERYWIAGGEPVTARVQYAKRWLVLPTLLLLGALLALGLALAVGWARVRPSWRVRAVIAASAALAVAAGIGVLAIGSPLWVGLFALAGLGLGAARRGAFKEAALAIKGWLRGLPERYRARERRLEQPRLTWSGFGRGLVGAGLFVALVVLLGDGLAVVEHLLAALM